jgi:sugar O-acyltransferase (sialic acid O-acetyltransferase NeuD family)
MTDRDWYIYGAGGLGVETMDILQCAIRKGLQLPHRCAFLVDEPTEEAVMGLPVVAFRDHVPGSRVTIAVGEPFARKALLEKLGFFNLVLSSVISPDAFVSDAAEIADGVIVAPHCSIQATSSIGRNVAVNTMSIVGHHVVVEENCVISSMVNLGGAVRVGKCSYLGMGALVKERLQIGHSSIVGMGSVVHSDVPDEVIALGNPARVARRNEDKQVFRG